MRGLKWKAYTGEPRPWDCPRKTIVPAPALHIDTFSISADFDLIKLQPLIADLGETVKESTKGSKEKNKKTEKIISITEAGNKVY